MRGSECGARSIAKLSERSEARPSGRPQRSEDSEHGVRSIGKSLATFIIWKDQEFSFREYLLSRLLFDIVDMYEFGLEYDLIFSACSYKSLIYLCVC